MLKKNKEKQHKQHEKVISFHLSLLSAPSLLTDIPAQSLCCASTQYPDDSLASAAATVPSLWLHLTLITGTPLFPFSGQTAHLQIQREGKGHRKEKECKMKDCLK